MDQEIVLFTKEELDSFTNNFSLANAIDSGASGCVYRGRIPNGFRIIELVSRDLAVKKMEMQTRQDYNVEVETLRQFNHANIVRIIGQCETGENLFIVMEFVAGKKLEYWVKNVTSWENVLKMFVGIAAGLATIHAQNLIHRDVKPDNIMVTEEFQSILIDFGSVLLEGDKENLRGLTRGYYNRIIGPAVTGVSTKELDLYAFGVTMLRVLMRHELRRVVTDAMTYEAFKLPVISDEMIKIMGCSEVEARKVSDIALKCVKPNTQLTCQEVYGELSSMLVWIRNLNSSSCTSAAISSQALTKMSIGEVACSYAAIILHDDGIPITAEKIAALVKAANVNVESYWPSLFAKLAEKRNLEDLIMNVGAPVSVAAAAPAAEEPKKEEPKEESDDDMGFNLFD